MIIMLFGITNVGKTSAGRKMAELLNIDFFDLDEEVKKFYNMTLEQFVNQDFRHTRDQKRGIVLESIVGNSSKDKVIAVCPIYYSRNFSKFLKREDVIAIELQDTPENIFDRLVFSDENDNIYEDEEYKYEHYNEYINDIKEDRIYYREAFKHIENKYFMDGKGIEAVAKDLIEKYIKEEKRR